MQAHELPSDSSESDEGIDRSFVEFSPSIENPKIFHDMVHPHLELPAICSRIINTPQFQRLRNLKQLGLCYYVYPSASHNRFEHCVGTSYLAGKYVKILQTNQPELNIHDKDILCLQIAGLLHDIGHGPFSHTWENFMHTVGYKDYSHEQMSLQMIDYLIEDNNLKVHLEEVNLEERDVIFIKECILGHPLPGTSDFVGRLPCKHFLYEVVSNGRTKIDVDKFDYLLRDCMQLGVAIVFDYQRLLDNSRVVGLENDNLAVCDTIENDTRTVIVYRKKIKSTLEDLFRSRFSMHEKAYQHRVTRVIEEMVLDGLVAADPYFEVLGENGEKYKLSTAWKDTSAFMKLMDSVFEGIMHWNLGGPKAAKIFSNIVRRNLYKFLGSFSGHVQESILDDLRKNDSNIRLIETKLNFGSGNKNPLSKVLLYEKSRPNLLMSNNFGDVKEERRTFILYCSIDENVCGDKSTDSNLNVDSNVRVKSLKKKVVEWAEKNEIVLEYE